MAVAKLLNLLAISCLAIIASYGPTSVGALSVDTSSHHARSSLHHAAMAKRKRSATSKRCKPRPSSASATKASTPSAPKPTSTKSSSNSGSNSGSGGSNSGSPKPSTGGNSGSSGGGGAGKAGIAWPLGNDPAIKNFKTWKTSHYYTWSPWCVSAADQVGFQCCPMLWGHKQVGDFTKLVKAGYAKCVMGFNEPDQPGQANMSPQDAAGLWKQYIQPLASKGYKLVSPATTNAPAGLAWMKEFFKACSGCQVDVVATHFYGTKAQDLINHVQNVHDTFGKNVWLTEFACQNFGGGSQCNQGQVFDFMGTVTRWMDSASFVEEYFAFGAMHDMFNVNPLNQLLGSNGQPTNLGRLYIGN